MRFVNPIVFVIPFIGACSSSSLSTLVDEHRVSTGRSYEPCGTIVHNNDCPASLSKAEQCILDAFAACRPAEAATGWTTDEGAFLPGHLFIDPKGDGSCQVHSYADSSNDGWKGDYPDLQEAVCAKLIPNGNGTCIFVLPDDCKAVD